MSDQFIQEKLYTKNSHDKKGKGIEVAAIHKAYSKPRKAEQQIKHVSNINQHLVVMYSFFGHGQDQKIKLFEIQVVRSIRFS